MKIVSTAILLIVTLLVVPIFSYFFGTALGPLEMEALYMVIKITAVVAVLCFVVGELTNNNSQVDKLWSIIPVPYVWITAYYGEFEPRLLLMAILVTIWAIRLTYNFGRRGGYSWKFWTGEEDYRWELLRAKPGFEQNIHADVYNRSIDFYDTLLQLLHPFVDTCYAERG